MDIRLDWTRHTIQVCLAAMFAATSTVAAEVPADRPNILWITCEDTGPQLGCYGDSYAQTPNLDRLAAQGLRYRHCWSNAPVCAPARTTIISGVYPTSTGSEHMRSLVTMPGWMRMYPQFLREQGYYCTNNSKEDYNLQKPPGVWDDSSPRAHWKNRKPGQPFFAIFNIVVSHESQIRTRPHTLKHDPAKVRLPAYHPDTPEVRHDWAQYYDKVTEMDAEAGKRLRELEAAGLAEQTIVFFYGDHGSGMPRSKRWLYNSGLHVPLIVRIPEKYRHLAPKDYAAGGTTGRLVSFVDLAPTLLSLIAVKPPDWMQGHAFLGKHPSEPQPHLFGFRGRMDERYDMVRSVRNERYVYVRNYMPHLIYGQHVSYMFETPTTQVWKRLYDAGKLAPPKTFFWEIKPAEELYDLRNDRDEVRNLADSPEHQGILKELRQALREHTLKTRDAGFLSEAEMHSRAVGTTIYEMAHDAKKYPLETILAMAELAASRKAGTISQLREGLKHSDSAVRYWAATGSLVRGADAVNGARDDLCKALGDPSPSVRAIAAWALGQFGSQADLDAVLPVLRELAPPDKNGAYVAVLAVNIIDALGPKAALLHEFLRTMPANNPKAVDRANGYLARLQATILGEKPRPPAAKPKRGTRKAASRPTAPAPPKPLVSVWRDPPFRSGDQAEQSQRRALRRILDAFVAESLPEGGIDAKKSLWQTAGKGSASGSSMFPGGVDVRYLRFLVEGLYRVAALSDNGQYRTTADAHVRFMARIMRKDHPSWALGNALEMIGVYHAFNPRDAGLVDQARRSVQWVRERSVRVRTADGVSFRHFPCGYGVLNAKDAGWTNDLSMVGSGLVWTYEISGDRSILEDAASFAEYFVQPWRAGAVGPDGYWQCGTWREDLGSWVVGPAHFTGFESTDAYGDEVSWVYSTMTCIDYLTRLHRHRPDPRFLDRCAKAAQWTFRACQFDDGAVGMCGRDDKWLGLTGDSVSQVVMLRPLLGARSEAIRPLLGPAERAKSYLCDRLPNIKLEDHGVEWVRRTTSTDPLVNVGMLWASAVVGWLNGRQLPGHEQK